MGLFRSCRPPAKTGRQRRSRLQMGGIFFIEFGVLQHINRPHGPAEKGGAQPSLSVGAKGRNHLRGRLGTGQVGWLRPADAEFARRGTFRKV